MNHNNIYRPCFGVKPLHKDITKLTENHFLELILQETKVKTLRKACFLEIASQL